jgi:hypothetical protein
MPSLPGSFMSTRDAVHGLAEHVLCAARYAAVGRIGLLPSADGIVTPPFDGRVVGVSGVEMVDVRDAERRAPITTLRAAGEFFGIVPAAPPLWTPTTNADLDAAIDVADDGVAALAAWFGVVGGALEAVHPDATATLWPEHFDLAVTVDGATYGGSPGDHIHPEPYLYVIPPGDPVPDGDSVFWNETFGASRGQEMVLGAADAVAFFTEAARRIATASSEVSS